MQLFFCLNELIQNSSKLELDNMSGVKTGLRRWLSTLSVDPEYAAQRMSRLKSVSKQDEYLETVYGKWQQSKRFPIYDILVMNTIKTQKTK